MDQSNLETPSLAVLIGEIAKAHDLELHTSFPAKIHSYDYETQKASIKPLYKRRMYLFGSNKPVLTSENIDDVSIVVDLPVIPGVPVHWPAANGGSAFMHFPIAGGDLGMAVCCERSLEKWLKSVGTEALTNDNVRHHSLSDAWFVPGICTFENSLVGTHNENIVIKNSNTTIHVTPNGKVSITNASGELISVLSDLISALKSATTLVSGVTTGGGTAVGAIDAATIAALTPIETKLNTFKV